MTTIVKTRTLGEQLEVLLREHADIKSRVQGIQRRRWLSPGDELELRTLQRLKLHTKDAIASVERSLGLPESRVPFD